MFKRRSSENKYCRLVPQLCLLTVTALTLVAGVVILFNSTLGWFSKNRNVSGEGMGVHGKDMSFPSVHAWRFDMDNEDGESFDKSGTWVEGLDVSTSDPIDLVCVEATSQSSNSAEEAQREQFTFVSLHLGTVDNLLDLSEDNCFYIRLDVTDDIIADLGTSVRASYTISDIVFYDNRRVDQTSALETSFPEVYEELCGLIDVDCAVSLGAKAMTVSAEATEIEGFFDTCVNESSAAEVTADADEYVQLDRSGTSTPIYTASESGGSSAYYIYVRLRPDLATCFDATHDISVYMPCQIVFDISLEFEFYTPVE